MQIIRFLTKKEQKSETEESKRAKQRRAKELRAKEGIPNPAFQFPFYSVCCELLFRKFCFCTRIFKIAPTFVAKFVWCTEQIIEQFLQMFVTVNTSPKSLRKEGFNLLINNCFRFCCNRFYDIFDWFANVNTICKQNQQK